MIWSRMGCKKNAVKAAVRDAVICNAVIFVTPGEMDGFSERLTGMPPTGSVSFVDGPGAPLGMGGGSVRFTTGSNGAGAAELRQTRYDLVRLDEMTVFRYSTFVRAFGSGGQAPYLMLDINFGAGTSVDGQLVFAPVYQDGTYPGDPVPDQGTLALGVWQTWDAIIGGWHTGGGPPLVTLGSYLALHPDARIINSVDGGGLRIVAGFGAPEWNFFEGNVDQLIVGVDNGVNDVTLTYNFEQAVDLGSCRSTTEICKADAGARKDGALRV